MGEGGKAQPPAPAGELPVASPILLAKAITQWPTGWGPLQPWGGPRESAGCWRQKAGDRLRNVKLSGRWPLSRQAGPKI